MRVGQRLLFYLLLCWRGQIFLSIVTIYFIHCSINLAPLLFVGPSFNSWWQTDLSQPERLGIGLQQEIINLS